MKKVNEHIDELNLIYSNSYSFVPMLVDANPTRGLKFIGYNMEEILLLDEEYKLLWKRKIRGITSVSVNVINNTSHENYLELSLLNNDKKYLSHTGKLLNINIPKLLDDRYIDYIKSGIQGTNYFDYELQIPVYYSIELEPGYYEINIEIKPTLSEYKIFNQDGLCFYFGSENNINSQFVLYEKKLFEIRSRSEIELINVDIKPISEKKVVHFIGDSTLANQSRLPLYGWAQLHQNYTKSIVNNLAYSARSLKSFCFEGRFNRLLNEIKPGDDVVIGFGHNDARKTYFGATPEEFEDYLNYYLQKIESYGAKPIITVPIAQRHYDQEGILINTHCQFEKVIIKYANKYQVINLNKMLMKEISNLGFEKSKELFNIHPHLEMVDNTHLSFSGAKFVNELFIKEYKDA